MSNPVVTVNGVPITVTVATAGLQGASGVSTMAGDVTGTAPANVVTTITGSAGVVTMAAGTVKETGTTLSIADSGGVVRDQFDLTHGAIIAGGGGSDHYAAMGPYPGNETGYSAFWALPNGATRTTGNYVFLSNGTDAWLNAPTASAALHLLAGNGADYVTLSSTVLQLVTPTVISSSSNVLTIGSAANALTVTGALALTTRTVTTNFTVDTTTTDNIILADTTSGTITITLPAPTDGRVLTIIDPKGTWGTHSLFIARHASELINNVASTLSITLANGRTRIWSAGGNWFTLTAAGP